MTAFLLSDHRSLRIVPKHQADHLVVQACLEFPVTVQAELASNRLFNPYVSLASAVAVKAIFEVVVTLLSAVAAVMTVVDDLVEVVDAVGDFSAVGAVGVVDTVGLVVVFEAVVVVTSFEGLFRN